MDEAARAAGQKPEMPGSLPLKQIEILDPIPTMEEIRKAPKEDRPKLLAKRSRMLREQKRQAYRERHAIPRARSEAAARQWRLRVYGSAWERARRAEAATINAKRGAAGLNLRGGYRGRYVEHRGRIIDRGTGRTVRPR